VIADCADIADTSAKRRTGLLKHTSLEPGEGLWIAPCEAVHTAGMKFAIDVVFLNKKRKILKVRRSMPKWRISASPLAYSVLELPASRWSNFAVCSRIWAVMEAASWFILCTKLRRPAACSAMTSEKVLGSSG